ncbi:MAG: CRISPR-associated protein [Aquificota bacterium]|nr:MAG: CRISPR-associated protein [Aquificota bacterium]
MFKAMYNQAKLSFTVEPVTPLLIRSGREAFDPTRPDLEFIRIGSPYGQVVYIPGSSIKGVMRSYAEKILRTLGLWTCDISETKGSCAEKKQTEGKFPYEKHCYACRTFGSTELASRLRIVDAYPWRWDMTEGQRRESLARIKTDLRPGVAIDRKKGTVKAGPFELEVVSTGTFYGDILLRNFQLWQLALVALVVRDIDEGYQQLGLAKSRGLGRVRFKVDSLELMQLGPLFQREEICGVGEVEGLNDCYDLIKEDMMDKPSKLQTAPDGLFRRRFIPGEGDKSEEVWAEFAKALLKSQNWQNLLKEGKKIGNYP